MRLIEAAGAGDAHPKAILATTDAPAYRVRVRKGGSQDTTWGNEVNALQDSFARNAGK